MASMDAKKAELCALWGLRPSDIDSKISTLKGIIHDASESLLLDYLLRADLNIERAIDLHYGTGASPNHNRNKKRKFSQTDQTDVEYNERPHKRRKLNRNHGTCHAIVKRKHNSIDFGTNWLDHPFFVGLRTLDMLPKQDTLTGVVLYNNNSIIESRLRISQAISESQCPIASINISTLIASFITDASITFSTQQFICLLCIESVKKMISEMTSKPLFETTLIQNVKQMDSKRKALTMGAVPKEIEMESGLLKYFNEQLMNPAVFCIPVHMTEALFIVGADASGNVLGFYNIKTDYDEKLFALCQGTLKQYRSFGRSSSAKPIFIQCSLQSSVLEVSDFFELLLSNKSDQLKGRRAWRGFGDDDDYYYENTGDMFDAVKEKLPKKTEIKDCKAISMLTSHLATLRRNIAVDALIDQQFKNITKFLLEHLCSVSVMMISSRDCDLLFETGDEWFVVGVTENGNVMGFSIFIRDEMDVCSDCI